MKLIETFPVSDAGEAHQRPKMLPLDWKIRLLNGREIVLWRIQQHQTYGGMLCGLPRDPEGKISESIYKANEWSGDNDASPIVIPATIVRGIRKTPSDPQFAHVEPMQWEMLPQVTTFARFALSGDDIDIDDKSSAATFIWWQNHFGIPVSAELLDRLRSINWGEHAQT